VTSYISIIPSPIQPGPGMISPSGNILDEDVNLLECFVSGTFRQDATFSIVCGPICQRPENPCLVDIDFTIEGDGIYELVPEYTLFSLDTTNGIDGTWHVLQPVETDAQHCGQFIEVHGSQTFRYVADMCDHISSFFSEPRVCFRITVQEEQDDLSTFGAFDDSGNQRHPGEIPVDEDPTKTPGGGCRQRYYGKRLPRS